MKTVSSLGLSAIGQLELPVRDANQAAEFYRDKLGLPLVHLASKTAFFDCESMRLALTEGEGKATDATVYFRVHDIESAAETLSSRGVRFDRGPHLVAKMPDHEIRMAHFRDPDGNRLGLISEVRRQANDSAGACVAPF